MMGALNFTFTVIIRVIFVELKLDPYNQVRFHGSEFRQTKRYFQSHITILDCKDRFYDMFLTSNRYQKKEDYHDS